MSHWVEGKLELKCSLEILRRALINIMPQWVEHIKVDPEGQIPLYTYQGKPLEEKTFHIIVPGIANPNYSAAPGVIYSDLGFYQNEDGSWDVKIDRLGIKKYHNIEGNIKGEIARMKAKILAKLRGYKMIQDIDTDEEMVMVIEVDNNKDKALIA